MSEVCDNTSMEAHIPTMFLMIIAASATLAVSVGSVSYRRNDDGLLYWAIALALHTVAYVLYSLRGQISDIASIVVANGVLSASFAMFAEALFQFQQRSPRRWLIWPPVIIISISFIFLLENIQARFILSAVIFTGQCLFLLLNLLAKRRTTIGRGQYFLAAGLVLLLAIFVLRIIGTTIGETATLSLTASNSVQAATYLCSLICTILLSLGFVLMAKERADERNYVLAIRDELTGLANRRCLDEALISEWSRAKRTGRPLALIMIDVDLFKKYNDRYGHQWGDKCLRRVAQTLQASAQRAGDLVARYGGEEFLLILADMNLAAAQLLAETIRQGVLSLGLLHEDSPTGTVTISAGIAVLTRASYNSIDKLLHAADHALYHAKQCGRNQVKVAAEPVAIGGNVVGELVQLVWRQGYECGDQLIDDQHRALFLQVNDLLAAALSERPTDQVATLIDAMICAVVQHFKDEEQIIAATDFPDVNAHADIHRQLLDRAGKLVSSFHAGTLGIGDLFQFLAHDVVAQHMLGADRAFFPYLRPTYPVAAGSYESARTGCVRP